MSKQGYLSRAIVIKDNNTKIVLELDEHQGRIELSLCGNMVCGVSVDGFDAIEMMHLQFIGYVRSKGIKYAITHISFEDR